MSLLASVHAEPFWTVEKGETDLNKTTLHTAVPSLPPPVSTLLISWVESKHASASNNFKKQLLIAGGQWGKKN